MNFVKILVAVVLLKAVVLQIVSLSIHYWWTSSKKATFKEAEIKMKLSFGLWESCKSIDVSVNVQRRQAPEFPTGNPWNDWTDSPWTTFPWTESPWTDGSWTDSPWAWTRAWTGMPWKDVTPPGLPSWTESVWTTDPSWPANAWTDSPIPSPAAPRSATAYGYGQYGWGEESGGFASGNRKLSEKKCTKMDSDVENSKIRTARALIILSILAIFVSGGLLLVTFPMPRYSMLLAAAGGVAFLQALLQGGGVGLADYWRSSEDLSHVSYGWAFYLGIGAAILYFLAAVLGFVAYYIEGGSSRRSAARAGEVRYAQMVVVAEP